MKTTKTITKAALLSAVILGSANAEFKLTDELSVSGYVDLSATYSTSNSSSNRAANPNRSQDVDSFTSQVVEVETAFAFNPKGSKYSALAEISFLNSDSNSNGSDNQTNFETVALTYSVNDALSFSVGNIYTYQGFETFDAPGLYQFSFAGRDGLLYSSDFEFRVTADYITDDYGFGLSVGENGESASYEVLAQYTAIENLTLKAIYANDDAFETINLWASYKHNNYTFALEYIDTNVSSSDIGTVSATGAQEDVEALVALVNYSHGNAGLTFRYTDANYETGDFEKYTLSPSYIFSNNLSGLLEYSEVRDDLNGDSSEFAAELIFTF